MKKGKLSQRNPYVLAKTQYIELEVFLMIRRPPRSTHCISSAASDVYKRQTQYIGFSPEHKGFAGTISLSSNLITSMIKEVGGQLSEMGFKRLILINGHGGQISLLNTAARELRSFSPGMAVFPCFLWSGVNGLSELLTKTEIEDGLHASLAETSLMLALKPVSYTHLTLPTICSV